MLGKCVPNTQNKYLIQNDKKIVVVLQKPKYINFELLILKKKEKDTKCIDIQ